MSVYSPNLTKESSNFLQQTVVATAAVELRCGVPNNRRSINSHDGTPDRQPHLFVWSLCWLEDVLDLNVKRRVRFLLTVFVSIGVSMFGVTVGVAFALRVWPIPFFIVVIAPVIA